MNKIEGMGMTWLEITLIVSNVVTIAVAARKILEEGK